jgi:hypothetical protein
VNIHLGTEDEEVGEIKRPKVNAKSSKDAPQELIEIQRNILAQLKRLADIGEEMLKCKKVKLGVLPLSSIQ